MTIDPASPPPSENLTGDPRWARIVARDRSADGQFWYSVSTTGVYCRPSCPSRRARPEHVRLHDTLESAQASGCRPCKRCHPDEAGSASRTAELIARACRLIDAGDEAPSLPELASQLGLSSSHLHRLFKAQTGLTPKAYAAAQRAARLRSALPGAASITEAVYAAGFNASSRFYEQAQSLLGMSPRAYRQGGLREELRFAIGASSLGALLVASSAQGVVSILLGDDPEALLLALQERFTGATLIGADRDYETLVAQVVALVEAPQLGHALPLDVRGTIFQQRVWQALRQIPPGQTLSYTELAERIGQPRAVRAVASACAANPLAVAIPCHRVVRTDGALAGYAWGIERKRELLAREAVADQPADAD